MDLSIQEKNLLISWATAFVARGQIDLQTSIDTTNLSLKIDAATRKQVSEESEADTEPNVESE